jgi:SAM-dependent methyltransferase
VSGFTGERLHAGDALFQLDLARHEAAYRAAAAWAAPGPVLDLGCGAGHGTALLAQARPRVFGVDRVPPDAASRGAAGFARADLRRLPFAPGRFGLVVSFQVIEHLEDPGDYLDSIARLLAPGGIALLTTPNVLRSDGVNPFHVHEYRATELRDLLRTRFAEVEVRGVGASDAVRAHLEARSRRIRSILRLDPLGLRRVLPAALVHWLFARFAVWVRRLGHSREGAPAAGWRDFPVGPADERCLDLFAVCRTPLQAPEAGTPFVSCGEDSD